MVGRYLYTYFILLHYGDLHMQFGARYDQPIKIFLECLLEIYLVLYYEWYPR